MQWTSRHIQQCEQHSDQNMQSDDAQRQSCASDFGRLIHSMPKALVIPEDRCRLQKIIQYAATHKLALTLRAKGLSQRGQSVPAEGGISLLMEKMNKIGRVNDDTVWVEAGATWADVLETTIKAHKIPPVLPYNCQLSVGGLLSAGGIGASSFKWGPVVSQVRALEVVTADGEMHETFPGEPLFEACLGGQGRFGVITRACLSLRECLPYVSTWYLLYNDKETWLKDMEAFKAKAGYLECFCTPAIQGSRLTEKGRLPFAEWFYALHVSVEFRNEPPDLSGIHPEAAPFKVVHQQQEDIGNYSLRHDSRFSAMKRMGQWELPHVWYECFISENQLRRHLNEILPILPLYYAHIVQVVPVKNTAQKGFFMLPDSESDCCALMILNPGLQKSLLPVCLNTTKVLDDIFLAGGGKRYLSGFLGDEIDSVWWQRHFGRKFVDWVDWKTTFDPHGIFVSASEKSGCPGEGSSSFGHG